MTLKTEGTGIELGADAVQDQIDILDDALGGIDIEDDEPTDEQEEGQEEEQGTESEETEQAEGEESDAEDEAQDEEEGTEEADEEDGESDDTEAYDVPAYWTKEEADAFGKLPDAAKGAFLELERKREAFTTRKSQELSREKQKAQRLGTLADLLETNEGFRNHVMSYGRQQPTAVDDGQAEQQDPMQSLEAAIRQKVLAEITPVLEEQQATIAKAQFQNKQREMQSDPMYGEVMQGLNSLVQYVRQEKGEREARALYDKLDSDIEFHAQQFAKMKQTILSQKEKAKKVPKKGEPPKVMLHGKGQPPKGKPSKRKLYEDARTRAFESGDPEAVGDFMSHILGDIE